MATVKAKSNRVRLELDDRVLILRLNLQAFTHLQDAWGLETIAELDAKLAHLGVPEMVDVFHASCLSEEPKMTRAEADAIVSDIGPGDFITVMNELMATSRSTPDPANPPPAKT